MHLYEEIFNKEIIWENLNKSRAALMWKRLVGWLLLIIVMAISPIAIFVLSFLANLNSTAGFVPFIYNWAQGSPTSFMIVIMVVPPIAYKIFMLLLGSIIRRLSRYQGAPTQSQLQGSLLARAFALVIIVELIIFTFIGVVFNSITQIIHQTRHHGSLRYIMNNIDKLPSKINQTYLDQASFWLVYFLYFASLYLSNLLGFWSLVWNWVKKYIFRRVPNPREVMDPHKMEFWPDYNDILFVCTVGLAFAPLVPLIPMGALLLMWLNSWVYKYEFMFREASAIERGGCLWNKAINRLLVSLLLMQAMAFLTVGLQRGWQSFAFFTCIPPFVIVLLSKVYIERTFDRSFRYYVPKESETRDAEKSPQPDEKIESRDSLTDHFGHPALHGAIRMPLLYPNMMSLLREIYTGRLD